MTGFAHAVANPHTGLVQIEGVGADGEPIHVQIGRMTARTLAVDLEQAANAPCLVPLIDDREPFDDSLTREEVERT